MKLEQYMNNKIDNKPTYVASKSSPSNMWYLNKKDKVHYQHFSDKEVSSDAEIDNHKSVLILLED